MEWFDAHLVSTIVFLPLAAGVAGLIVPSGSRAGGAILKAWTLGSGLVTFWLAVVAWSRYVPSGQEYQLLETASWIPSLGISYRVGLDGIALVLMVLTAFLAPIVTLSSFGAVATREREYYFLLQMLQTGMLGAFASLDLFLFYVFWEAMLIPMYFLIGIWGGKDRVYAAMKFFLYTLVGSLLMLVAIFYLAHQLKAQQGAYSTALEDLYKLRLGSGGFLSEQGLLFMAFALAFAIKVPLFPLHTWLPDAHVQAPTAGSVILAGVLLKFGGFGFMRYALPLFPGGVELCRPVLMALAATAVVYGAWVAMVQPDIKKLVAYSSVSHMGYVVLGILSMNAIGATGAVYQMLNHGISTGGLFLLVGMIYERRHTREISEFGGIARKMPLFAVAMMIMTLSSIALPGTNGFVGEFLILLGTWKAAPWVAAVSATGVVFGAVYMLLMVQRLLFGKIARKENEKLVDLGLREAAVLLPLIAAVFAMGMYPAPFLRVMEPAIGKFVERSQAATALAARGSSGFVAEAGGNDVHQD